MAVGQFQIQGLVQGSPNPQLVLPPYYIPVPTAVPSTQEVHLSVGFNVISYPLGGTGNSIAIIVPPNYAWPTPSTSYTGTLTLKGVTGDTGVPISNTYPTFISGAGESAIGITASAVGTITMVYA
jgi:hypothetical protein